MGLEYPDYLSELSLRVRVPSQKPWERGNPMPILQKGKVTQEDELMGPKSHRLEMVELGIPWLWTLRVHKEPQGGLEGEG